jgi:hypothetical protein
MGMDMGWPWLRDPSEPSHTSTPWRMDRWIDIWMDGWIDRYMDGWMDIWMDGWMDLFFLPIYL